MDLSSTPVQITLVVVLAGLVYWWFKMRPQSY
jgi:hypothetical protein